MYSPTIPINNVLKENKNKMSIIVNEKPEIGSKNNLLIIIKMKKNTRRY